MVVKIRYERMRWWYMIQLYLRQLSVVLARRPIKHLPQPAELGENADPDLIELHLLIGLND